MENDKKYSLKSENQLILILFFSIIVLIVWSSIILQIKLWKIHSITSSVPVKLIPSLPEIHQNFLMLFHYGINSGYGRSLWGILVFVMMSSFYISTGRMVITRIFKAGNQVWDQISVSEKLSYYFTAGSLIASLLWFILGLSGILNFTIGFAIAGSGLILIMIDYLRSGIISRYDPNTFKNAFYLFGKQFSLTEKILLSFLVLVILLLSTKSFSSIIYSDALITHLALPNYYIMQGKVIPNPYHFMSYFPENTEMLVLWALLLKSDVAAMLMIWGYFIIFVLLIYGFLKRCTNGLISIISVYLLISAPVIWQSSIMIKNDLPATVFILAHYFTMIESLNCELPTSSASWIFLSGIFCGGALGHKLNTVPMCFISAIFIMVFDWQRRRKSNGQGFLTMQFLAGMILAVGLWMIRTYWMTGNPIYPLLNEFLNVHPVKPWHVNFLRTTSTLPQYCKGVLLGYNDAAGPGWGPSLFVSLLIFPIFLRKSLSQGFRYCLGSVLLTLTLMLSFLHYLQGDIRYHMAFLSITTCVPFALTLHSMRARQGIMLKSIILGIVLLCFMQNFWITDSGRFFWFSLKEMISGNLPGNYVSQEPYADNMRWITHIINTRTQKCEGVLLFGVGSAYGLNRKFMFSFPEDKQVLAELSENSRNVSELKNRIRQLGMNHILLNSSYYDHFKYHPWQALRISVEDLQKIKDLLNSSMVLCFQTPDKTLQWYTFKGASFQPEIILSQSDAIEYPVLYIKQAEDEFFTNHSTAAALSMLETAVGAPMSYENKIIVYNRLGNVYFKIGDYIKSIHYYKKAIDLDPTNIVNHNNLALCYIGIKDFSHALEEYVISLKLSPNDQYIQDKIIILNTLLRSTGYNR